MVIPLVAVALAIAPVECVRERMCLNGVWDVGFVTAGKERPVRWRSARVPSTWGDWSSDCWDFPETERRSEKAIYRLSFRAPTEWRRRKTRLFLENVCGKHVVSLNGRTVGGRDYEGVCERIDVTDALRPGVTNELEVTTFHCAPLRGLRGDVWIESTPKTSLDYVLIDTSVRKREIAVRVGVDGTVPKPMTLSAVVMDGDRAVLELPRTVVGTAGVFRLSRQWKDPVLWGYGEYGTPHLYTLKVSLCDGQDLRDVRYERFGFREFSTNGDRFVLNGKPIFLKGDLYTKTRVHAEHPAAITAWYLRQRASGQNFLRGHAIWMEASSWFEIADEVGFLVQPEMMHPFTRGSEDLAADSPEILSLWRDYVIANYNHPSLVSWCVDNETFSVGLTSPENLSKLDPMKVSAYNRLIRSIHRLDPERIVEINHNYSLYDAVKRGTFDRANFEVFNIHPYGSLQKVINGEVAALGFKGEVPILVGEVFAHEKPVDPAREPDATYAEQVRIACSYFTQIRDAAATRHVSGIVLCAESQCGWFGWEDARTCRFGPWDSYARELKDGSVAGIRHFAVQVPWPSLSGPGTKVQYLIGWAYLGGNFGLGLNWFDPSVPMFRTGLIDRSIRAAFDAIGGPLPPLPGQRRPEIVARVPKAEAGSFVYLSDALRPGVREGVLADPEGTAWFRLPSVGAYALAGVSRSQNVEIASCPELLDSPGYGHLAWVDLGGGDSTLSQERLRQEPKKEIRNVMVSGELLENGSFDYLDATGQPYAWSSCPSGSLETASDGCRALRLRSGQSVSQVITLEKTRTYRLTGSVTRRTGTGVAKLTVMNWGSQGIRSFACVPETCERQRFSFSYTSDGTERYLSLSVDGAGTEFLLDDFSLQAEELPQEDIVDFSPGPFALSDRGMIRNFLIMGPFPNRGDEHRGYDAATNDYLLAVGGEQNATVRYRGAVNAVYPDGFYWRPGEYVVHWRPIAFDGDIGDLRGVVLPAAGITRKPSDNVAAYLACVIVSPVTQDAILGLGSDDGYVVYVNGRRIGSSLTTRGAALDQEKYPVRLEAGENRLLIKAIQEGGEWQVAVRLTDRKGKALRDVNVVLPGEASMISNGNFEMIRNGQIVDWSTPGCSVRVDGCSALCLSGNVAQATRVIGLKGGHRYLLEGMVRAETHDAHGVLGVRTLDYDWLCKAEGKEARAKRWETLKETFTAPFGVPQAYFYCMNWYVGDQAVFYTNVRLFDLGESDQAVVISRNPGRQPHFKADGKTVFWKTDKEGEWCEVDIESGRCDMVKTGQVAVKAKKRTRLPAGTVRVSDDGRIAAVQTLVKSTANLRFVDIKTGKTLFRTAAVSGKMQITGCHSPVFVPGTRRVIYVSGDIQPVADLMMTDLVNGRTVKLTTDGADNQSPDVSPDGKSLVFSSYVDGEYRVKLMRLPK